MGLVISGAVLILVGLVEGYIYMSCLKTVSITLVFSPVILDEEALFQPPGEWVFQEGEAFGKLPLDHNGR